MMKAHVQMQIMDSSMVDSAFNNVIALGLLCPKCEALMTRDVVAQSDFCATCQAVIEAQLMGEIERQLKQQLEAKGIDPNVVQIIKKGA